MTTNVDDVDLARLLENIRYITKRATIDNELKDRIISALDNYESLMNCDINTAFDLARDLTIVRALIKKESDDLERKFNIFDKKLRKITNAVLPKEEDEEDASSKCYRVLTTFFQDNDIRIIDTVSRVSALNKLEECRELLCLIKEAMRIAESPDIPLTLKSSTFAGLSDIIRILKVDGALALKLKKDVLDVRIALKRKKEGEADLDNRLKIIKLKVEKCKMELDKKEDYYKKLKIELDEDTERAMAYLEESLKGFSRRSQTGCKKSTVGDLQDECQKGAIASRVTSEQPVPSAIQAMPTAHGWLLTPIDPNLCQLPFLSTPAVPPLFGVPNRSEASRR